MDSRLWFLKPYCHIYYPDKHHTAGLKASTKKMVLVKMMWYSEEARLYLIHIVVQRKVEFHMRLLYATNIENCVRFSSKACI